MSRRKDGLVWALIILVLLLIVGTGVYALWPQLQPHTKVHIGDAVFTTQVAKTPAAREKGLSGTSTLHQDQALLLVFDRNDKWPIWMKDMKYPIDIVWLNEKKEVVYIVKNAAPESYPYEQYAPKQDARYILELPAGTVSKKAITIGKQAMFDENHLEGWGT